MLPATINGYEEWGVGSSIRREDHSINRDRLGKVFSSGSGVSEVSYILAKEC